MRFLNDVQAPVRLVEGYPMVNVQNIKSGKVRATRELNGGGLRCILLRQSRHGSLDGLCHRPMTILTVQKKLHGFDAATSAQLPQQ